MKTRPILYLDTSLWRRLDDEENPDLRRETREFMRQVARRADLRISTLVTQELREIPFVTVRRRAIRKIQRMRPRVVTTSGRVHRTVRELLAAGCLSEHHLEDVYHIAYALVCGADNLVTWDKGDLARPGTQRAVRRYCKEFRVAELIIDTPVGVGQWLDVAIG